MDDQNEVTPPHQYRDVRPPLWRKRLAKLKEIEKLPTDDPRRIEENQKQVWFNKIGHKSPGFEFPIPGEDLVQAVIRWIEMRQRMTGNVTEG